MDKAFWFLFVYYLPSKEAKGIARLLLDLCLTFEVPSCIRADRGGEFTATVTEYLYRWIKVQINFGPADHPRGQDSVERAGEWIVGVLSKLCKAWPTRWNEHVALACSIKRALSRKEALRKFPIRTKIIKTVEGGKGRARRSEQVYDLYSPYWRVRFADNDWGEELAASKMSRFGG